MNRRSFISLFVAAACAPKAFASDGVALNSIAHPIPMPPLTENTFLLELQRVMDEAYAQCGVNWKPFINPTRMHLSDAGRIALEEISREYMFEEIEVEARSNRAGKSVLPFAFNPAPSRNIDEFEGPLVGIIDDYLNRLPLTRRG
jgi:hypothetical protein